MIPLVSGNARDAIVVAFIALAPMALVLIVGMLKRYTIDVHLSPPERREHKDD